MALQGRPLLYSCKRSITCAKSAKLRSASELAVNWRATEASRKIAEPRAATPDLRRMLAQCAICSCHVASISSSKISGSVSVNPKNGVAIASRVRPTSETRSIASSKKRIAMAIWLFITDSVPLLTAGTPNRRSSRSILRPTAFLPTKTQMSSGRTSRMVSEDSFEFAGNSQSERISKTRRAAGCDNPPWFVMFPTSIKTIGKVPRIAEPA